MDTKYNVKRSKINNKSTGSNRDTSNTIQNLLKHKIENSTEYIIDKYEKVNQEDYDNNIEYYNFEQLTDLYDDISENITTETKGKLTEVNNFDANDNNFISDNSNKTTDVDNHLKLQLLDPQKLKEALGCFMCSHISCNYIIICLFDFILYNN